MTLNEKKYSRLTWLETAVKGIRFGPDREAAARELLEHLEDKTEDLMRIFPGMSRPDADEMALSQMGDPEEIGKELAKIHTPWLGYLWRASQALLAAAAVVLVIAMSGWVGKTEVLPSPGDLLRRAADNREAQQLALVLYGDGATDEAYTAPDWLEGAERTARYVPNKSARLGDAQISMADAALWEKEGKQTLAVRLTVEWDRPWEKNHFAMYHFQAEDSLGNRYGYELIIRDKGASLQGLPFWGQEHRWNGWTRHVCLEDFPAEAEWVRFTYALRPDSDFELVLNLNREVGK